MTRVDEWRLLRILYPVHGRLVPPPQCLCLDETILTICHLIGCWMVVRLEAAARSTGRPVTLLSAPCSVVIQRRYYFILTFYSYFEQFKNYHSFFISQQIIVKFQLDVNPALLTLLKLYHYSHTDSESKLRFCQIYRILIIQLGKKM